MTPDSIKIGPQPEGVSSPARVAGKPAELVLLGLVTRIEQEPTDTSQPISLVTVESADRGAYAQYRTRPAQAIGTQMRVFRLSDGRFVAMSPDGDHHHVHEMSVGNTARARAANEPPFPPMPDELVAQATQLAESLGLRLQVRRTGVEVISPRGKLEQPFIETWENTLNLVGLSEHLF